VDSDSVALGDFISWAVENKRKKIHL